MAYLGVLPLPGTIAANGLPKVSETLLRQYEQADASLHVDAITFRSDFKEERSERRGNVTYHYLPCKSHGKALTFYLGEIAQLRKRLRGMDVDVVHGQPGPDFMLAAVTCGLPHVITIHGLPGQEASMLSWRRLGQRAMATSRELLHRQAIRRTANIISISPYVEDYIRPWVRGRVWSIANPIDQQFFEIAPPDRSGLRIICVGSVAERKNQQLLVRACAELARRGADFECRLIGPCPAGSPVRELIESLELTNRVTVVGVVSQEALLDHYSWCNVVALPSRGETSPLSLIQAMAGGRCVFGAEAAGIPALLHDGEFGSLFSPDDPEQLSGQLLDFGQRPDCYWEKAARAADYARNTFRADGIAQKTLELYRQIAATSSQRGQVKADGQLELNRAATAIGMRETW
ncbi:MAG: glycosyltransferase [Chthoniobacterales bacterium]